MAVYAASDWHGHFSVWEQVKKILQPEDRLYFLGDAADRGPDGWQMIKEMLADERVIYIKGNHDEMLCDHYFRPWYDDGLHAYNGGRPTWEAVCKDDPLVVRQTLDKLRNRPDFDCYVNEQGKKILFTHSGSANTENHTEMIWDRSHFKNEDIGIYDIVIHGHTPAQHLVPMLFSEDEWDMDEDAQAPLWYAHNKKCCMDNGTHFTHEAALINVDTFEWRILCV